MGEPDQMCEILAQKMTLEARAASSTTPSTGATKKPSWKKDYSLPPCKVCGGEGSGIHYGINTCEACKGFFRRSLARKESYKCRQNQKCKLEAGKRNMCSACRFKKCLEVGMSTEGIKIGRYTTEKRRQDTVEVKNLKAEHAMVSQKGQEKDKEKRMAEVVEIVVEAGRKNFKGLDHLHEELAALQGEINKKSHTERSLINALEFMSTEEFNSYLQGIEPKRDLKELMFNKCMKFIEQVIRKYIKFAKAVPGFKRLPLDDQVALVKASHADITTIYKYQFYVGESELTLQHGQIFPFGKMCNGLPPDQAKQVGQMASKFRNLELTEEELQLFYAMLLCSPDRCTLKEPEMTADIQQEMVDALQWLMARNHDSPQLLFAKVVSVITDMRSFELFSRKMTTGCMKEMATRQGNKSAIPALILEIMS